MRVLKAQLAVCEWVEAHRGRGYKAGDLVAETFQHISEREHHDGR